MKKKTKIIIITLALLLVCTLSYSVWAYYNPVCELGKGTPADRESDFYIENYMVSYGQRTKLLFISDDSFPEKFRENVNKLNNDITEEYVRQTKDYIAPTNIKISGRIEDGKTIISYKGTVTNKSDGKTVDFSKELVFDFVITKEIQN